MKIKNIESVLVISFFAIIIVLFFNEPINDYIGIYDSNEITLLLRITAMLIFIIMLVIAPAAMGTEESNAN